MKTDNDFKNNDYEKLKCIWMASQVIEYKLCDRQFDCENCLFDQGMRNMLNKKETHNSSTTNVVSEIFNKLQNIKYDNKIVYLKNNLIAKEICQNTFYLGINPILDSFLDAVNSITFNDNAKNISAGEQLIQICGGWGSISLSAPMNLVIYDKVADPSNNPLKSQWFVIVGDVNQEISNCKIYQEEWDKMYQNAVGLLDEIKSQAPKVGNTMMDGGTQINYLYQIIGIKSYINILRSLCG